MRRLLPRTALLAAVLSAVTAWLCIVGPRYFGAMPSCWIANALLVGFLLRCERASWPAALGAAWVTYTLVFYATGVGMTLAVGLALANCLEAAIALWALGNRLMAAADLMQPSTLWRFFGGAVLLAPFLASLPGGSLLHRLLGTPLREAAGHWFGIHALGMAVTLPLVLALRPAELIDTVRRQRWHYSVLPMCLLCAVALLLFSQSGYPLLIVVLPPLLFVTFRLGFAGAAFGIVLVVAITTGFSALGSGPFAAWPRTNTAFNLVVAVQFFTATMILLTYPVSAVILAQDKLMREMAASEQRFRLIAENASDLVSLVDVNGLWRYVSPSLTSSFGWHPQDVLGTDCTAFVHPEDVEGFRGGIRLLAGGQEMLKGVFRVRHRDGHYLWVESMCRLLRDASGRPSGWVSNARDISNRKRIEQIKDEFISTVNHELRTPLTAMLGSVGLALSGRFGPLSEPLQRLLEMTKANGDRLARLVNDILDFGKVSSGKMQFRLQPLAVDALIEQAVSVNRVYGLQFDVALQVRARSPGTHINVDPDRFQQVMSNLLSNAAKFSRRGGQVEVDAVVIGESCRISVVDHGCGIPAAFRSSLFERFAQADSSDQRVQGGTGLGMAIAKRLTEAMAGTISYESEEGRGTTFHLDFPLVHPERACLAPVVEVN